MAKTGKREPRDAIRRLEATLRSTEFGDVVQAYRRRFGLPLEPQAIKRTDSSRPDEVDWEKARLYDEGRVGEMARAVARVSDWLNISLESIPILGSHVFYYVPFSIREFVTRFADPLRKVTLRRVAEFGKFHPPGSVAAIHGRRAAKVLALPQLLRQDLPLLLLVEDMPNASWLERVQLWNERFPHRQVHTAKTFARYHRAAHHRDTQRRATLFVEMKRDTEQRDFESDR